MLPNGFIVGGIMVLPNGFVGVDGTLPNPPVLKPVFPPVFPVGKPVFPWIKPDVLLDPVAVVVEELNAPKFIIPPNGC